MDVHHFDGNSRTFAVVLLDGCDPRGTTVHVFSDPELWEWLHHREEFPGDVEAIDVPIPGTDLVAYVTRWDSLVDKAQNLACLPGTGGQAHPLLIPLDLGPSDSDDFREAYARLRDRAEVVEGRW